MNLISFFLLAFLYWSSATTSGPSAPINEADDADPPAESILPDML